MCKVVNVINTIEELLKLYIQQRPMHMGNGAKFSAPSLQGWCKSNGYATAYILPGSPWKNQFV